MYQMISKVKTKIQEPCVYALCFNTDCRRMVQVIAYSLEEAIDHALTKLKINDPVMPEMYCYLSLQDFKLNALTSEMIPDAKTNEKNKLMQKIIDNKDLSLIGKKKSWFTVAEIEYMEGEIEQKMK